MESSLERLPLEIFLAICAHLPDEEDLLSLAGSHILRHVVYNIVLSRPGISDRLFRYAVKQGDRSLLRAVLAKRPGNVNREALHFVCSAGQVMILAVFLSQPSSRDLVSELSEYKSSLCTKLLTKACNGGQLNMMYRLLAIYERASEGRYLGDIVQPLDETGRIWSQELVTRLRGTGVKVQLKQDKKKPVLIQAIKQQNTANVEQLIELGAAQNISEADWRILFQLYYPFRLEKSMIRVLFLRIPLFRTYREVWEAIFDSKCIELLQYVMSFDIDFNSIGLYHIIYTVLSSLYTNIEKLKWSKTLVERGATITLYSSLDSPIKLAIQLGDLELCKFFMDYYIRSEASTYLLPNLLAFSQCPRITRYLLEIGIDPNTTESTSNCIIYGHKTPLLFFIVEQCRDYKMHENTEDKMKCLELFVSYGADISLRLANGGGETHLSKALSEYRRNDLRQFFIQRGASL